MKKILMILMIFALLLVVLQYAGCKQTSDTEKYLFTVTVGEGVTGTPGEGSYSYSLNDQVEYSYTLEDGYTGLTVTLDGDTIEPSGTITVTGNHDLNAFTSQGTGQYLLSVSLATGVTGTPEEGYYYYDAGDQVDYSYSLEDGYTNIVVTIDGVQVDNSGTLTISDDHVINVYAEIQYDIRGEWTLEELYADQSTFTVTVTFTGDAESGTVVDSDGGVGTYTVDGNDVNFTLEFPDVTYEYTGVVSDEENMSGESQRYTSPDEYSTGSWSATKNTTGEASKRTTGKKGKR